MTLLLNTKKSLTKAKKLKIQEHHRNIRNTLARTSNPSQFWQLVKALRKTAPTPSTIPLITWENFYSKIYPPRNSNTSEFNDEPHHYLDTDFSYREIKYTIRKSKKNKSPGPDAVLNEHIQHLPPCWLVYLKSLLNKIWHSEEIPQSRPTAHLTLIHEKGPKENPSNYRGIALLNNLLKILTSIIQRRINHWMEDTKIVPEEQAGFRSGRSCLDQIFTITTALQSKIRLEGNAVYCIFIDFRRAFDSVPHNLLWNKLFKLGVSGKTIRTIRAIYEEAKIQLRVDGNLSKKFDVTERVLQGDKLSPTLFILRYRRLTRISPIEGIRRT